MSTDAIHFDRLRGKFLAFEGPDGSGKTTQYRRFLELCRLNGLEVCEVREPGGTAIGEQVREILLNRQFGEMSVRCEMLLYMASRAQLVEQRIRPALAQGHLVLADRFIASTLAYQGTAGGLPMSEIAAVAMVSTGGLEPDLNVVFDVDEDTAAKRLNPLLDRMEAKGRNFHARVRNGYLDLCLQRPDRYLKVDASCGPEEVWTRLLDGISRRF